MNYKNNVRNIDILCLTICDTKMSEIITIRYKEAVTKNKHQENIHRNIEIS